MALAMNRYIGNSVLPLLISHAKFYNDADNYANLLDATLHTVYRLSKNRMLTKGKYPNIQKHAYVFICIYRFTHLYLYSYVKVLVNNIYIQFCIIFQLIFLLKAIKTNFS